MANLRDWAEGGPEALATPMIETGPNPINLSTPGSASQEHQHREEAWTKRRADEEESSSSSLEDKEESPISLDSDEEECGDSDTPLDPGRNIIFIKMRDSLEYESFKKHYKHVLEPIQTFNNRFWSSNSMKAMQKMAIIKT